MQHPHKGWSVNPPYILISAGDVVAYIIWVATATSQEHALFSGVLNKCNFVMSTGTRRKCLVLPIPSHTHPRDGHNLAQYILITSSHETQSSSGHFRVGDFPRILVLGVGLFSPFVKGQIFSPVDPEICMDHNASAEVHVSCTEAL